MKSKRFFSLVLVAVCLLAIVSLAEAFPSSVFFFRDKHSPLIELEFFAPGFSQADWQAWRELIEELKKAGYRQVEENKFYEFTHCSCLRFVWEKERRRIEAEEFIPVEVIYEFRGIISLKSALKKIAGSQDYKEEINPGKAPTMLAGN